MKRHSILLLFSSLALVFVLSFFWPGPYRYEKLGGGSGSSLLIRVNRFSGRTEIFRPSAGWDDRHPGATPEPPLVLFVGAGALLLVFFAGFFLGRRAAPLA